MQLENELVIPKIFSDVASKFSDKIALQIKKDNQWLKVTYQELEAASHKLATFLIKEGFKKGDCAVLILENRPEWAIIYLGIVSAGLTCVPLDPQLPPFELKNLILDSSPKLIFSSSNIFIEKIKNNTQEYPFKFVILDNLDDKRDNIINFSDLKHITGDTSLMPSLLPEDIASLIYTSGTTAKPKGVLLSHKNISSNFRSIAELNICFPSDNTLALLPLYHTYPFMVTLIVPLFLGGTITYCSSFNPQEINQLIREAKITILVGVPQFFSLFDKAIEERIKKIPPFLLPFFMPLIKHKLRRQLGNLRLLVSGGARLEPKLARHLSRLGFKLIEGYGLTETSPVVTINPPDKIKFGSVGLPLPGVQLRIDNPDKSGIGEVLIKGPNVMQGYFKQPELTKEVIKEGWFYSGDLGYLDKEGYLFLTGRKKDVIVLSSGKNIFPEELEEYYSHSPYIKEMCIFSRPENKFGHQTESLSAVIIPDLEYFRQKNEKSIQNRIRWELENLAKSLPSYQHIMGFTISKEELPRTNLKKIKRYAVREKYLAATSTEVESKKIMPCAEDKKILELEVAQKIINYLSSELKKSVCLESHLEIDLGIDSLTRVELGLGLEALLKIKIPDTFLYNISTVKELITDILKIVEQTMPGRYQGEEIKKNWAQILRELPPQEKMLKKIRIKVGFLDRLLTLIFKGLFLFILRSFWCLKIKGKEFLPKEGPYILCPNHASYLDGFVIFSSIPFQNALNTFFLGYSAIFEHPLVRWGIKSARLIPIDPNINLVEAMQYVSFILRHQKTVCIFPEGRRSIDENIGEFKKGIGILIKELDIPVIPVYLKGSHRSWPRTSRFPRLCALKIIFGQPVFLKDLIKRQKQESLLDDYEIIARKLREEVLKLQC